jgi:uncharacterized membrane protein YcaP (DUF421 family)
MDPHELVMTALRAVGVYVLMLAVIRALGKRTVGNFTAFDLLVALMLGEVVDEIVYGDVGMAQGVVAIAVIAAAQYSNSWLSYWDHGMDRILEGKPTPIVRDGALQTDGLRQERMNPKDALAELRLQGVEDLGEVRLAQVEVDGQVSVIRQDWASPVQKADVFDEAARERDRARAGGAQGTAPAGA